jgi:hypothetical protein
MYEGHLHSGVFSEAWLTGAMHDGPWQIWVALHPPQRKGSLQFDSSKPNFRVGTTDLNYFAASITSLTGHWIEVYATIPNFLWEISENSVYMLQVSDPSRRDCGSIAFAPSLRRKCKANSDDPAVAPHADKPCDLL